MPDDGEDQRVSRLVSDITDIVTQAVRENDEAKIQRLLSGIGRISPSLVLAINRIITNVRSSVANETIT
jgi:hypothetical protein